MLDGASAVCQDPDTVLIRVGNMIKSPTNSNEFRSKGGTVKKNKLRRVLKLGDRIYKSDVINKDDSNLERLTAVAEWYRYWNVACLITSSSLVPLKTRCVGQRSTLNLSRAETSSQWCGVVVRKRRGASSGIVHVT
ncbi:uncharacterized protein TNCV_1343351 [Trichonephila clavipes]|nr:uncharacterized protein TNCV_1343351 [Trichonephila clavipes]